MQFLNAFVDFFERKLDGLLADVGQIAAPNFARLFEPALDSLASSLELVQIIASAHDDKVGNAPSGVVFAKIAIVSNQRLCFVCCEAAKWLAFVANRLCVNAVEQRANGVCVADAKRRLLAKVVL